MIDHTAVFDRIFRRRGGRLDPTSVGHDHERFLLHRHRALAERVINYYLQRLRRIGGNPLQIYFDFVDRPVVNAGSAVCDDWGYIGLYSGAVYGVYDLFYRMMAHPEFIPEFGDPSAERIRQWHSQGISRDYGALIAKRPDGYGGLAEARPFDRLRNQKAESLAVCALDFFVLHELAHIINGHCGYANSLGMDLLLEADTEEAIPIPPMESQAMEADADSSAIYLQIWQAIEDGKYTSLPVEVCRWGMAMSAMFMLFGIARSDYETIETLRHPPAPDRAGMAAGYASIVLQNAFKGRDFSEFAFWYLPTLQHGCLLISDEKFLTDMIGLHFSYNAAKDEAWRKRLGEAWISVRPKLVPYAFHDRLALTL